MDLMMRMQQANNLYENILHNFERKGLQSMKNKQKLEGSLGGLSINIFWKHYVATKQPQSHPYFWSKRYLNYSFTSQNHNYHWTIH